jgi:glycosyltransferase involved in cell wall biosynthesis
MRVLISCDAVGGTLTQTAELVAALGPRVEATVVVAGPEPAADQLRLLRRAGAARVELLDGPLEWMAASDAGAAAHRLRLIELARDRGAELVQLGGYSQASGPWQVPRIVVGHSCVVSWWRAVHGAAPPAEWDTYRRLVRDGIRAADAVVAPSGWMLDQLRAIYGPFPGAAAVIENGVSGGAGAGTDGAHRAAVVLAAGRVWDEGKNLAMLDRAAAGLSWPVLIAGEGGTDRLAHARGLGRLPAGRLAAVRRRSAIFAAPARYEPFGLAILEAARDGCALVLADIPSLRELWDGAALFVDPGDAGRLRRTIQGLIDHPAQRLALARAAGDRAVQRTSARMADRYLALYRSLLLRAGVHAA